MWFELRYKFVIVWGAILMLLPAYAWTQYQLTIIPVDEDSLVLSKIISWKTSFRNRDECAVYVNNLTTTLQTKGFPAASLDSVYYDSAMATIRLFLGDAFQLADVKTMESDKKILEQSGWFDRKNRNAALRFEDFESRQQKILENLENNGYTFAKLQLDSFTFKKERKYLPGLK